MDYQHWKITPEDKKGKIVILDRKKQIIADLDSKRNNKSKKLAEFIVNAPKELEKVLYEVMDLEMDLGKDIDKKQKEKINIIKSRIKYFLSGK